MVVCLYRKTKHKNMNNAITINEMRSIVTSQFFSDLTDDTKIIHVNSTPMSLGYWNLICSIRDVKLFSHGVKIHRLWKFTDVKKYFGVKGDAHKIAQQLEELKELMLDEKLWNKWINA